MALAIELAAARLPSLGLDGLEAGLADRLVLLTGGSRLDDRHRSLRAALDWSYRLLDEADQAVLRRVSVFAGPFAATSVCDVLAGWDPVDSDLVPAALARLADHSLLVTTTTPGGTRYRALETIRQYGATLVQDAGEEAELHARHLSWILEAARRMVPPVVDGPEGDTWRADFDVISVETRQALPRVRYVADQRDTAYEVSRLLAELSFARGRPGECQRRYELAAELAPDDATRMAALRLAAGAAEARQFGNEALRLHQLAAEAALRAGNDEAAALDLALAAELIGRGPGIIRELPPPGTDRDLLDHARALAPDDPVVVSRVHSAEAFALDVRDDRVRALSAQALELALGAGDPLGASAALDALTSAQLAAGELSSSLASAVRRTELLAPLPFSPESALEFFDCFQMVAQCALAAGDLAAARRWSEELCELPFYREEDHLAHSRLVLVAMLTGNWDEALDLADMFRNGWERAGRPVAGNLRPAPYAAATICAFRGDEAARTRWMDIVDILVTPGRPTSTQRLGNLLQATVLLHRGEIEGALATLADEPEDLVTDYNATWRPWYAGSWAEASVLAGLPDAEDRVERARALSADNPVAQALVLRAEGLARAANDEPGSRGALTEAAEALRRLGVRYEAARTLVMLGGADRERGEQELAALGATPMVWPVGQAGDGGPGSTAGPRSRG
jgi:hypothetical protein